MAVTGQRSTSATFAFSGVPLASGQSALRATAEQAEIVLLSAGSASCGIPCKARGLEATRHLQQPGLLAAAVATGLHVAAAHRRTSRRGPWQRRGCGSSVGRSALLFQFADTTRAHLDDEAENITTALPSELSQMWGPHSLTANDLKLLQRGLPVQKQERKGTAGSGLVVFEVNAPPLVVLDCLGNFEDYTRMIPVVRQAEVLSRRISVEGSTLARLNYRISKFWLSLSVVHVVDPAAGTVRFDLDRSSCMMVLREASGFWQVEQAPGDHPGRSRIWLRVSLRASSLLPNAIVDYAAERALRRATSWLKPYTEDIWREQQLRQLWKEGRGERRREPQLPPGQRFRPSVV